MRRVLVVLAVLAIVGFLLWQLEWLEEADDGQDDVAPDAREAPYAAGDGHDPVPLATTKPGKEETNAGRGTRKTRPGPGARSGPPGTSPPAAPPGPSGVIRGRAVPTRELSALIRHYELLVTRWKEVEGGGTAMETRVLEKMFHEDGTYELSKLAPGRYLLQVVLNGKPISESKRLTLRAGETAAETDFYFARRESVTGRVFAVLDGAALGDAVIQVEGESAVRTDADGAFMLHDLPPGTHKLLVRHRDHAASRSTFEVPAYGPTETLSIHLQPGSEARITVIGKDGRPLAGVSVQLSTRDYFVLAVTDTNGVAHVRGLEAGVHYAVRFTEGKSREKAGLVIPERDELREVTLSLER